MVAVGRIPSGAALDTEVDVGHTVADQDSTVARAAGHGDLCIEGGIRTGVCYF